MTPATGTETPEAETPREWRTRRSAELRQQMREGYEPRSGEPWLQRLQAEEAAWWGFEQGREEQRELVRELREGLDDCVKQRGHYLRNARALLARTEAPR